MDMSLSPVMSRCIGRASGQQDLGLSRVGFLLGGR